MEYQLIMGYLMPKFDYFVKALFALFGLMAYQLLVGYLMPKFDYFVKA